MMYHPLVLAAIASKLGYKINLPQTEELVAGILQGFSGNDDLPVIQTCIENGPKIESEIEQIVSDFAKKDVTDIIKAIQETLDLINEFPQDLQDCTKIEPDIDLVGDWAKNVKISKIPGNVVKHLLGITKDINKIQDQWSAQQFQDAGMTVDDILFKVLGAPGEELPEDPEFLF